MIGEYENYLQVKRNTDMQMDDEEDKQDGVVASSGFDYDLEHFDYVAAKAKLREMFSQWLQDPQSHNDSLKLLSKFKQQTANSASSLCEQLRIVLEPQLS